MLIVVGLFSGAMWGPAFIALPICEWIGVFVILNYFAIMCYLDNYFETVGPAEVMGYKKKRVIYVVD